MLPTYGNTAVKNRLVFYGFLFSKPEIGFRLFLDMVYYKSNNTGRQDAMMGTHRPQIPAGKVTVHVFAAIANEKEPSMITISTCMIVKNEERVLARCLDCVKIPGLLTGLKKSQPPIPSTFLTSRGTTISLPHGIFRFPKRQRNTSIPLMRTK